VRGHLTERNHHVPRLDRSSGQVREQGRVQHVVLGIGYRRVATDAAGEGGAGEAAADDEHPTAGGTDAADTRRR
jgi:hypothetical protein